MWARKKEVELADGKHAAADKTFGDILTRYKQEFKAKTKQAHYNTSNKVDQLLTYPIAKVKLKRLDATHFAEWRDTRNKEVSGDTVLRDIAIMYAAMRMAISEWKWIDHNPLKDIKKPKRGKGRERRISENEVQKIIQVCGYHPNEPLNNRRKKVCAVFLLALETGMRLGEIVDLTTDRIFLDRRVIHLRAEDVKNGEKRDVPLSGEAIRLIKQADSGNGFLFEGLTKVYASHVFTECGRAAGIADLHFHDTRHEATARLSKKLDPWELARALGHTNINQTLKYYQTTADESAKKL
jgi:integrase